MELNLLETPVHGDFKSLDEKAHLAAQILLPALVLLKVLEDVLSVIISDQATLPLGVHVHGDETVQVEIAVLIIFFLLDN